MSSGKDKSEKKKEVLKRTTLLTKKENEKSEDTEMKSQVIEKTTSDVTSLTELNKMISILMNNSAQLEEDKKKLENENKKLEDENKKLENENKELKAKLNGMSTTNVEAESYKNKFLEISSEYTQAMEQIEKLKKEKNEISQQVITLNEVTSKLSQMEEMYLEKEKQVENLTKELEFEKNKPQEDRLNEVMAEKQKLAVERDKLEEKVKETTSRLNAATEAYKKLDEEYGNYRETNENANNEVKGRYDEYEKRIQNLEEQLKKANRDVNDSHNKLNETLPFVKKLQNENEKLKRDMDSVKADAFNEVEAMKQKMQTESKSTLAPKQIQDVYSEYLHMLYQKEFALSYQDLIDNTLLNFNTILEGCFNYFYKENTANPLTILHDNLKDIYFLTYNRAFEQKRKCTSAVTSYIPLNPIDFTPEIVSSIVHEIYLHNPVLKLTRSSKELIEQYLKKIETMNIGPEAIKLIKDSFVVKVEKNKQYTMSSIKALVEKCISTIKNGTIEFKEKMIFDFRTVISERFILKSSNLYADMTQLTNESAEALMNIIKYPKEPIVKLQFVGKFNFEKVTEQTIMRVLLSVLSYIPNVLSFSLTNCDNLSYNIVNFLLFILGNLTQLKILNLDSDLLGDDNIKLICEELKAHKTILALVLSNNNIQSAGGVYLSDCISMNRGIERLYLSSNSIVGGGLSALLTSIMNQKKVSILDLNNNKLTAEDFECLGRFLHTNPKMALLNLSNNKLDMQGSIALGAALTLAKQIKTLSLVNINLTSDYSAVVFKAFYCEELILDDNPIDEVGAIMFSKVLVVNTTIKKLSLNNTKITSLIGLTHLTNSLNKNTTLTEMHLRNNKIDENGCDLLNKFMKGKPFKLYLTREDVVVDKFKDPFGKIENVLFV